MVQWSIDVGTPLVPNSLIFDEPGNSGWVCGADGAVLRVGLWNRRVSRLGDGYSQPVAAIPDTDGITAAVFERGGAVFRVARSAASRPPQAALTLGGEIDSARRHPDAGKYLALVGIDDGVRLHVVDLGMANPAAVAIGPVVAVGSCFAVDEPSRRAWLAEPVDDTTARLLAVSLDDGTTDEIASDIERFGALVATDGVVSGPGVFGIRDHRVAFVQQDGVAGGDIALAEIPSGVARWGDLLLAQMPSSILAIEWGLVEGDMALDGPLGPLFVNGYVRMPIDPGSVGVGWDELFIDVPEGPDFGRVSAGIEADDAPGGRSVALIAGLLPGQYHFEIHTMTGQLLARRRFRVTDLWPDNVVGPPVTRTEPAPTFQLLSWGGTGGIPSYSRPAPAQWRVLAITVTTKESVSGRWTAAEASAVATQWKDTVAGSPSLRAYYEEVSYHNPATGAGMTVKLEGDRVFGPVDLDVGWGEIFEPEDGSDDDRGWGTKKTGAAKLAGAISAFMADQPDGHGIMSRVDAVVIITKPATLMPTTPASGPTIPSQFVWEHARRDAQSPTYWRKHAATSTYSEGPRATVYMSSAHPGSLGKNVVAVLCHEIGHTLGLADLYQKGKFVAELEPRMIGRQDLMHSTSKLWHLSIANRMRLGWVKSSWLRRFDFALAPVGGPVTLHAIEDLTSAGPPAGRFAGVEVPVSDGRSYLFELKRGQPDQIGDQELAEIAEGGKFVGGSDLRPSGGETARPPLLRLPRDVDDDGPILLDGMDYRESDVTNPSHMHDFAFRVASLSSPDDNGAEIDVEYIGANRPQVTIRPAPGDGNFKSPDIEIIGPFGVAINGARKGMPNLVRITVRNVGTLAATEVVVHVKWLPFTVSPGAWENLPDPPKFDIAAGAQHQLDVNWEIPKSVPVAGKEALHFCVRVDIERYRDPAHPEHEEIVVFDNWAQSNFDAITLPFGSPSERHMTVATAANDVGRSASYLFGVNKTSAWYRVYLGNAWLQLAPDQTAAIELGYESLKGDPVRGKAFDDNIEQILSEPERVALSSWLAPHDANCGAPHEWWGANLEIRTGQRVYFGAISRGGELLTARCTTGVGQDEQPVHSGTAIAAVWPEDAPGEVVSLTGDIDRGIARVVLNGATFGQFASGRVMIVAMAMPANGSLAQSVSEPQHVS